MSTCGTVLTLGRAGVRASPSPIAALMRCPPPKVMLPAESAVDASHRCGRQVALPQLSLPPGSGGLSRSASLTPVVSGQWEPKRLGVDRDGRPSTCPTLGGAVNSSAQGFPAARMAGLALDQLLPAIFAAGTGIRDAPRHGPGQIHRRNAGP